MITEKELKILMFATSNNFKFKLDDSFDFIFKMIFGKIKHLPRIEVEKKFQQLLLMPSGQWNKRYGFGGYPSFSDWMNIILDERPKTDEQKKKELEDYEKRMSYFVGFIIAWLHQPSISEHRYFLERYKDPKNKHLKEIIDAYAKVNTDLTNERIIDLARYLERQYEADRTLFKKNMCKIAKEKNLRPVFEFEPKKTPSISLPILNKM